MKCINCPALLTEGYEYPETYCGIGVPDSEVIEYTDGESGCARKSKTIIKEFSRIQNEISVYYGEMGDGMAKMMMLEDELLEQTKNVLNNALKHDGAELDEKASKMVESYLSILDENYIVIREETISGGLMKCFSGESEPRCEGEADFINDIKGLTQYWCDSKIDNDAEKLSGLLFSIVGVLDHNMIVEPVNDPECGNIAGYLHERLGFYKSERI